MTDIYAREGKSILGVQDVSKKDTRQYGIVGTAPYQPRLELIHQIIEKPDPENAPSTLAVVGRCILNSTIFQYLENLGRGAGGEIQLTDGIAALLQSEAVFAYRYHGRKYDCGSQLGYLKANLAMGLKHPEIGEAFANYLKERA